MIAFAVAVVHGTNLNASSTATSASLQHSFVVTMVLLDLLTAARRAQSTNESPYVSGFTKLPHVRKTSNKSPSVWSARTLRVSLRVVLTVAASTLHSL